MSQDPIGLRDESYTLNFPFQLLQACRSNDFSSLLNDVQTKMDTELDRSFDRCLFQQNAVYLISKLTAYANQSSVSASEEWILKKKVQGSQIDVGQLVQKNGLIKEEDKKALLQVLERERNILLFLEEVLFRVNQNIFQDILFLFEQIISRKYKSFQSQYSKDEFIPKFNCVWDTSPVPILNDTYYSIYEDINTSTVKSYAHFSINDLTNDIFNTLTTLNFNRYAKTLRRDINLQKKFTTFVQIFSQMTFLTLTGKTLQEEVAGLNQSFEMESEEEEKVRVEENLKRPCPEPSEQEKNMLETCNNSIQSNQLKRIQQN